MKNNYEIVKGLPEGTIFRFGDGAPWMRSVRGVMDLIGGEARDSDIPKLWQAFNHVISIIFLPGESAMVPKGVVVNVAIFDMEDNEWSEESGGPLGQAIFWAGTLSKGERYAGELQEFLNFIQSKYGFNQSDVI